MLFKQILLVGLGGGIGSIMRFLNSHFIHKYNPTSFPLGTFTVNIIGCFIIGLLAGYFSKFAVHNESLKLLFLTGFCGGYTTFSAFALENFHLFNHQQYSTLVLYTLSSIILGCLAVALGFFLIKL